MKPPRYLPEGDVMELGVKGLGRSGSASSGRGDDDGVAGLAGLPWRPGDLARMWLSQYDNGMSTPTGQCGGTAAAALLPSREFLSTDDPDEAEFALREVLCEHRISLRGPAADFHASVALAELADLRIAHFRYGAALDITAGPPGRHAMNFTLGGVSRVRHGNQWAAARTGAATIFSPVAESELTWSSDLDLLCLVIPAHALERHFRKLTGIDEPIHFRPGVDPGRPAWPGRC